MTEFSEDVLKALWEQLTDDERHFFLGDGRPPTWRESELLVSRGLLEWTGSRAMGRYMLTDSGRALKTYGTRIQNEPQSAEDWRSNALGHIQIRLQTLWRAMNEFDTTDHVAAAQMSVCAALIAELKEVQSLLGEEPS